MGNELTEATNISLALQVFRLHTGGMKLEDALEEVNISDIKYRYWLRKGENVLVEFRHAMIEAEREQLHNIIVARTDIITKIIDAATGGSADIGERIAADKHLRILQEQLESRAGVHGVADDEAAEFLKRQPILQEGKSRFTVNIKPHEDGSVDISVPMEQDEEQIVDAYFTDNEDQNGEPSSEPSDSS